MQRDLPQLAPYMGLGDLANSGSGRHAARVVPLARPTDAG